MRQRERVVVSCCKGKDARRVFNVVIGNSS
jgi:hypothetical protein